jgi:protease IV
MGVARAARRAVARVAGGTRRALARRSLPREPFCLALPLREPLAELPPAIASRGAPASLLGALLLLDAAARDPRVSGVLLQLGHAPAGWSGIASLRRAVWALRAQGKPVAVYAESLDAPSLLLASAASRLWLPETGSVHLVGLRAESLYLRDLLARAGVRADVVRIGDHKAAAETLTRDAMSPEQRGQLEAYLDDVFGALLDGIAEGRGLTRDAVRALVDRGPFAARAAQEAGLVDACLYPDQLEDALAALLPTPESGPRHGTVLDARAYAASQPDTSLAFGPAREGFAYVVAEGGVSRGAGARGIGSESFGALFERLRKAPDVRGVALRIESPGGDALASDLLWRGLERLAREKPVVASLGEVAASGGYYLACAADAVFAEAGTLTGSIGVIGGKLDLGELYQRLGIARDGVTRGARAGMTSEARPFSADERRAVREGMAAMYASFVDRVARGRKLAHDTVLGLGGGRIYSGRHALELGLVDALGGPLEALHALRKRAGFAAGERASLALLPRAPAWSGLRNLLRWLS